MSSASVLVGSGVVCVSNACSAGKGELCVRSSRILPSLCELHDSHDNNIFKLLKWTLMDI